MLQMGVFNSGTRRLEILSKYRLRREESIVQKTKFFLKNNSVSLNAHIIISNTLFAWYGPFSQIHSHI